MIEDSKPRKSSSDPKAPPLVFQNPVYHRRSPRCRQSAPPRTSSGRRLERYGQQQGSKRAQDCFGNIGDRVCLHRKWPRELRDQSSHQHHSKRDDTMAKWRCHSLVPGKTYVRQTRPTISIFIAPRHLRRFPSGETGHSPPTGVCTRTPYFCVPPPSLRAPTRNWLKRHSDSRHETGEIHRLDTGRRSKSDHAVDGDLEGPGCRRQSQRRRPGVPRVTWPLINRASVPALAKEVGRESTRRSVSSHHKMSSKFPSTLGCGCCGSQ